MNPMLEAFEAKVRVLLDDAGVPFHKVERFVLSTKELFIIAYEQGKQAKELE